MDSENITVHERSQMQKPIYYMTAFICSVQNRKYVKKVDSWLLRAGVESVGDCRKTTEGYSGRVFLFFLF